MDPGARINVASLGVTFDYLDDQKHSLYTQHESYFLSKKVRFEGHTWGISVTNDVYTGLFKVSQNNTRVLYNSRKRHVVTEPLRISYLVPLIALDNWA